MEQYGFLLYNNSLVSAHEEGSLARVHQLNSIFNQVPKPSLTIVFSKTHP